MPFEIKTKTNMFLRPLALSSPIKVSKWSWRSGKNKMLSPDEQKQIEQLSDINKFKELLIKEEKTKPLEGTTLLKWLISEGLIKNAN